jgi:hypothetical protein
MKNKLWVVVLAVLCVYISSMAFAETVTLKSGKVVEGKLLEQTDKYIKIDFDGVILTYFTDEIAKIDKKNKDDLTLFENAPDDEGAQAEESNIPIVTLKDGSAGIQQINEAYYSLSRKGFQSFECELTINVFESAKEALKSNYPATDPKSKVLDDVKFHMTFDKNEEKIGFNHTPFPSTGDSIIDDAVKNNNNYAEDALGVFFGVWGAYVGDINQLPPEQVYTVEKLPNGYVLSYNNKTSGKSGKVQLDNKLRMLEDYFITSDSEQKTKTHFINSKQGFLLQSFESVISRKNRKISAAISYQEVDGFQLPKEVRIKINSSKNKGIVEIKFFNYKTKKIS